MIAFVVLCILFYLGYRHCRSRILQLSNGKYVVIAKDLMGNTYFKRIEEERSENHINIRGYRISEPKVIWTKEKEISGISIESYFLNSLEEAQNVLKNKVFLKEEEERITAGAKEVKVKKSKNQQTLVIPTEAPENHVRPI